MQNFSTLRNKAVYSFLHQHPPVAVRQHFLDVAPMLLQLHTWFIIKYNWNYSAELLFRVYFPP